MRDEYEELLAKISETDVERWTKLVERERKYFPFSITLNFTYGTVVHDRATEVSAHDTRVLKETLAEFRLPVIQMSDQLAIMKDNLDSKVYFT